MSRQPERLQLGPQETKEVLERYDVGDITDVTPFERGSRRSPKAIVRTLSGTYLLKRRAPGQDDMRRIQFQHAVQLHLEQHGCPVAGLHPTKDDGSTIVRRGSRVYELFHFIEGTRFDSSLEQAESAGRTMARMHEACMNWDGPRPSGVGYHGSPDVERGLARIEERIESISPYCRPLLAIFIEAQSSWAGPIFHGPSSMATGIPGICSLMVMRWSPCWTSIPHGRRHGHRSSPTAVCSLQCGSVNRPESLFRNHRTFQP